MGKMKKLVTALLAALLLCQMGVTALADGGYGYVVRILPGNIGQITGQSTFTAGYGESVTFDIDSVVLPEDSPYYVKGIREAGRDNDTFFNSSRLRVTEDADYVVAYGIKGHLVHYTVNFLDEQGNTLAPSETYVGNEGDKPVIAFLYIDNYEPRAYNLTKTLSADESENVFDFIYRYIPPYVPPTVPPAIAGAAGGAAAGGAGAAGDAGAGGAVPDAGGGAGPGGGGVAINEEDTPLTNGPQELLDLDEEDAPLAKAPTERQQERSKNRTMLFLSIGLLALTLAVLTALIVLLVKRRRRAR